MNDSSIVYLKDDEKNHSHKKSIGIGYLSDEDTENYKEEERRLQRLTQIMKSSKKMTEHDMRETIYERDRILYDRKNQKTNRIKS